MDEADRNYMMELLTQLRTVKERIAESEKEAKLWSDRVKLAEQAGKADLAEAARERAVLAMERIAADEKVLMELEVRKNALKNEVKASRVDDGSVARANALLENLKDKPWNPEDARFDRMAKEASADDALAALKRKMGGS